MSDDLKVLAPQEIVSTKSGDVVVKPFKFTQFPRVIEILSGFSSTVNLDNLEAGDIVNLLMKNQGQDLFELMCMASGQSQEWLDQLEADEGIELLMKVVEQNMDFFNKKLIPTIARFSERVASVATDGAKLSAG
ncbi:MAG: DUF6631 family protein [Candidatus Nanopelagicaceae bacterium]